jgi:hypothetical protein
MGKVIGISPKINKWQKKKKNPHTHEKIFDITNQIHNKEKKTHHNEYHLTPTRMTLILRKG